MEGWNCEEEEWTEYNGGPFQEWLENAIQIRVASGVTVIPAQAFMDCEDLMVVDLKNVTTISKYAFDGCSSLERIIWPASAFEIGLGAFGYCGSLREIDLRNATGIGQSAFEECDALERVTIPSSVMEIENKAFMRCSKLGEVELCEGIQRIGIKAFRCCKL